jgi:hypothetical protein
VECELGKTFYLTKVPPLLWYCIREDRRTISLGKNHIRFTIFFLFGISNAAALLLVSNWIFFSCCNCAIKLITGAGIATVGNYVGIF